MNCLCNNSNCDCCIQVTEACVEFGKELVLDQVTFAIRPGVLIGVVGPNGGGKSTLFNALVGLQPLAHGKILINGHVPSHRSGILSYVPQKEQVNWRFPLSVLDVAKLGLMSKGFGIQRFRFGTDPLVKSSLEKVEMWEHRNELVSNLSGGQRQRTFIARALVQQADILILDEAFSGVDVASQEGVLDVLRNLRNEGKTILVATHDLNTLSDRFDEVICINRHICAQGHPNEVFTREVLIELYGSHADMFDGHQIARHSHVN